MLNGHAEPQQPIFQDEVHPPVHHQAAQQNGFQNSNAAPHLPPILEEEDELEEEVETEEDEGEGELGEVQVQNTDGNEDQVALEVQVETEEGAEQDEEVEEAEQGGGGGGGEELHHQAIQLEEVQVESPPPVLPQLAPAGSGFECTVEDLIIGGISGVLVIGLIILIIFLSRKHPKTAISPFTTQDPTLTHFSLNASEPSVSLGFSFTLVASLKKYPLETFKNMEVVVVIEDLDFALLRRSLSAPTKVNFSNALWFQEISESVKLKELYKNRLLTLVEKNRSFILNLGIRNVEEEELDSTICPIKINFANKNARSLQCHK